MDNITQQMKSVALLGDANKSDANDFNAGLFKGCWIFGYFSRTL
jgi:hypothetical protein